MSIADGNCRRAVRRGTTGNTLSENDCRAGPRCRGSRGPEAQVVGLAGGALRQAVGRGVAAVDDLGPGVELRFGVEICLAAACTEDVEFGGRPITRGVDAIVTGL